LVKLRSLKLDKIWYQKYICKSGNILYKISKVDDDLEKEILNFKLKRRLYKLNKIN
jgi:hypothetical protein